MRVSVVGVCLILVTAAVYGDDPIKGDRRQPAAARAAWEWSADERISKRTDPESIRERAQAKQQERAAERSLLRSHAVATGPVEFVVDGRRNPELLMRFELFHSILDGSDARFRQEVRSQYSTDIRALGWEEGAFWQLLETAAAEYFRVHGESLALQDRLLTLAPPERRELQAKIEAMGATTCRLRFDALSTMRTAIGAEAFDRFLYSAVAPRVTLMSRIPVGDEARRLAFLEGGCR